MFSIDPHAHSTAEIDNLRWARKGGVPVDRVLNAFGLEEFASYLKKRVRVIQCHKFEFWSLKMSH